MLREDEPQAGLATIRKSVLLFAFLLFCGCQQQLASTPSPNATQAPAASDSKFFVGTDGLGRPIELDKRPERIISLAPANTELLFAVGAQERIAGVTTFCTVPSEATKCDKIGGFIATSINVERIVRIQPDLILAGGSHQQSVITNLERAGLTVYSLDPQSVADALTSIQTVGDLTGNRDNASQLIAEINTDLTVIENALADIPDADRQEVFYRVSSKPLMTAAPGSFLHEIMDRARARNAFSDLSNPYPTISLETLVQRDPGLLLVPTSTPRDDLLKQLQEESGWKELQAVQEGRVCCLDEDLLSRPGPRIAKAIRSVAEAIYPARFAP